MQASTRVWSSYQTAIFDWVQNGSGHALVAAVAGSGKTTTAIEASKYVYGESLFCAFNKSIVDDISSRLENGMVALTLNSLGHRILAHHSTQRLTLESAKYTNIAKDEARKAFPNIGDSYPISAAISKLVGYVQSLFATDNDSSLEAIMDRFSLELPADVYGDMPAFYNATRATLAEGIRQASEFGIIAFNDQIWLPNVWNLTPRTLYNFIFVDEAQDLSMGKLLIVMRHLAPGGRILFIGDPQQAIYGFAGADPRAWSEIKKRTNATELALSVCYRCPTSVLDLARNIVAQILARDGAPTGNVIHTTLADYVAQVAVGDLILCRKRAPLVRACLQLIKAGVPARIKGKDIGKAIIDLCQDVLRTTRCDFEDVGEFLTEYVDRKVEKLQGRKGSAGRIESLRDTAECLAVCLDSYGRESFGMFRASVEALFDEGRAAVRLSTIHGAKGLEERRVAIIEYSALGSPLSPKQSDWEMAQERNLLYVALTRAKETLFLIG